MIMLMLMLRVITLVITAVMLVIFLAYVLFDTLRDKRIKKLKELNRRLIEQNKSLENDYHSIYENMVRVNTMMRKFKKENEELKKQLDKQEHVTYHYYINKQEEIK